MTYFLTFLQSNFLEIPFFCWFHHRLLTMQEPSTVDDRLLRSLLTTTVSNAITHPIVFFVILAKGSDLTWGSGILLAEAFAIIAETFLHCFALNVRSRRKFLVVVIASALANLVSWELGPLLTWASFLRPFGN